MSTRELRSKTLQTGAVVGCLTVVAFVSLAVLAALPKQDKTVYNLRLAYQREANTYVTYLAFAERAQEEEFGEVASLFRAAACAEHIHLKNLAAVIRKMGTEPTVRIHQPVVKTTWQNLQTSARLREAKDRDTPYPAFIEVAKAEGNPDAARVFQYIRTAEVQHVKLFKHAMKNLKKVSEETHLYYVCSVCGYTAEQAMKPCPGCSDHNATYEEVF